MAKYYPEMSERDWDRFNKKVTAPNNNGCSHWDGHRNPKGYGTFRIGSSTYLVHKLVFVQKYGQVPDDLQVRHLCPGKHSKLTRSCVNVEHLEVGTAKDNGADQAEKGTFKGVLAGEKNGMAKLTDDEVVVIHGRVNDGETLSALSSEFGVSEALISQIKHGRVRQHLELPETQIVRRGPRTKKRGKKPRGGPPTAHEISLFKKHCAQPTANGCIRWNGATDNGYGQFTWRGKSIRAHRFAYLLAKSVLLSGWDIAHTCADRACVNPGHLAQKTRKGNMSNPKTRARISKSNQGNRGNQRLSDSMIEQIKVTLRDEPTISDPEIVERYKLPVGPAAIARIRKGQTGTHVSVAGFEPRKKLGAAAKGSRSGRSKLAESDVLSIRDRAKAGENAIVLAEEFDVSRRNIDDIVKRRTWKHL